VNSLKISLLCLLLLFTAPSSAWNFSFLNIFAWFRIAQSSPIKKSMEIPEMPETQKKLEQSREKFLPVDKKTFERLIEIDSLQIMHKAIGNNLPGEDFANNDLRRFNDLSQKKRELWEKEDQNISETTNIDICQETVLISNDTFCSLKEGEFLNGQRTGRWHKELVDSLAKEMERNNKTLAQLNSECEAMHKNKKWLNENKRTKLGFFARLKEIVFSSSSPKEIKNSIKN
jgi:hypothetical protein